MAILESGEMYLENIYVLKLRQKDVRSIDIANYANFTKPSVSRAMSILKKEGYITMDRHGFIELTDAGLHVASKIYERHLVLTAFFKSIGVDPKIASEDACKIEHYLSDETFEKIKELTMQDK